MNNRCEMAIEILQKTQDGNILSPQELSLIEGAVNDWLIEKGEQMFNELYQSVMNGTFVPFNKRWFRDVENITADTKGAGGGLWIYYKGINIEHYDLPWAYSEPALKALQELKHRCETVEARGDEVNANTVIWDWKD